MIHIDPVYDQFGAIIAERPAGGRVVDVQAVMSARAIEAQRQAGQEYQRAAEERQAAAFQRQREMREAAGATAKMMQQANRRPSRINPGYRRDWERDSWLIDRQRAKSEVIRNRYLSRRAVENERAAAAARQRVRVAESNRANAAAKRRALRSFMTYGRPVVPRFIPG